MKKTAIISIIVALLVLLAGCANIGSTDAGAFNENGTGNGANESTSLVDSYGLKGEERKIHFYTGSEDYSDIDSTRELQRAIDQLEALRGSATATEKITITVTLVSDLARSEGYKAIIADRGKHGGDIDKAHEWRERLNSYVKEYHQGVFATASEHITFPDYCTVTPDDYSPFVTISADFADLESRLILDLATSEYVAVVCVSFEMNDMPDDDTSDEVTSDEIITDDEFFEDDEIYEDDNVYEDE